MIHEMTKYMSWDLVTYLHSFDVSWVHNNTNTCMGLLTLRVNLLDVRWLFFFITLEHSSTVKSIMLDIEPTTIFL